MGCCYDILIWVWNLYFVLCTFLYKLITCQFCGGEWSHADERESLIQSDQYNALMLEMKDMKRQNKQLQEYILDKDDQIRDLTSRLAQELNIKMSADETSLENISIPCRPMKIVEDYQHFTSNAWLDAKEALDTEGVSDDISRPILCEILMIGASKALHSYEALLRSISAHLNDPLQAQGQHAKDLPKELIPHIGDYLRRNVDNVDLTLLEEKIRYQIQTQSADTLDKSHIKAVDAYIQSAASLAWKMILQRPPMTFSMPDLGKPFKGQEEHPLAWNSEKPQEHSVISAYQYPGLMHGDKCMVRGQVYLGLDGLEQKT